MSKYSDDLEQLKNRIPRRHSVENVVDINAIVNEYEDILIKIESQDADHEKIVVPFFADLEEIRSKIKLSNSNKASKKNKDVLFDEASGLLKDSVQGIMELLG